MVCSEWEGMLASREWRDPRSQSYYGPGFDWFCSDLGLMDGPIWRNEPAQCEQIDAMAEMIYDNEWVMDQHDVSDVTRWAMMRNGDNLVTMIRALKLCMDEVKTKWWQPKERWRSKYLKNGNWSLMRSKGWSDARNGDAKCGSSDVVVSPCFSPSPNFTSKY